MAEDADVDIQPITRADFVPAKVFRSRSMNTLTALIVPFFFRSPRWSVHRTKCALFGWRPALSKTWAENTASVGLHRLRRVCVDYCITLYFRGKKISRKVNLKYFREKIFSRMYCSRENIFPRKYLPAKISSRENILSRKYLPAKISSRENIFPRFFLPQICRLVDLGYAVYRLFRNL